MALTGIPNNTATVAVVDGCSDLVGGVAKAAAAGGERATAFWLLVGKAARCTATIAETVDGSGML